ncbi:two-component system response regulator [Clostridium thailandense]|uniref:Response regulator n=1 Tax=Clostridium thailandense TaxID=2794346 RepID=A0A949U4I0_9CLOT|nr:response regulator [Clostridium thailandense]MBV7276284.1 response regulator [Clostridium thailandense]MCH5137985.1 response regulator [Clostridiaceae bacterium UIB06]
MEKVLIVNDCKFERVIIKDCLVDIGYDVEIASEFDAIIKVKKFKPDILIANLIMKNTTGDELIKKIKSENSQIICLLSSCDLIRREDYLENGIDEVIHTPINRTELSRIFNTVIERHNVRKSRMKNQGIITENSNSGSIRGKQDNGSDPKCSTSSVKFSFCPFCGQNLNGTYSDFCFCPYCGKQLSNSQ